MTPLRPNASRSTSEPWRRFLNSPSTWELFLHVPPECPWRAPASGAKTVEVIKTEEKGSDVNLATHLLVDGFREDYECAVVISNDSDLAEPVRVVRRVIGKPIGVVNPHLTRTPSEVLTKDATFVRQLRRAAIERCQFPPTLEDHRGTIRPPETW